MIIHVLSYYYGIQVKVLVGETKVLKAHKYNVHFGYKPGDPGFIAATTDDGRGGVWKKGAK